MSEQGACRCQAFKSRRAFLKHSGGALAGISVLPAFLASSALARELPSNDLPIVDTHVHLWDRKILNLDWIEKGSAIDRSFSLNDYRKATAGLNVVKGVYMEVGAGPEQWPAEAKSVLELCHRGESPMAGAVINGAPASDDFAEYLKPFAADKFLKGVRHMADDLTSPSFIQGVRRLGTLGLRFDLHPGGARLEEAAKLVDACLDTQFILDHCGNAEVRASDQTIWKRGMSALARRKNVVAKVSGIVAGAEKEWMPADLAPIVNHTLDTFGPDRVMFAGDWPVCTQRASLSQWVNALKQIVADRSREEQRKLFHDNAVRVYALA